ncbi:MAG: RNA ligase family protein, partial [Thiotrichaceae bacterium]
NSYQKIPEFSGIWAQNESDAHLLRSCHWCVTEKIHGANFCWIVTTTETRCAKRKAVLEETDDFFNYQIVKERLLSTVRQVFDYLVAIRTNVSVLYIYGELFGGSYPRKDVPPDLRVKPVQTEVYYSSVEYCVLILPRIPVDISNI